MFEHRREPLLPRALFIWRVLKFSVISLGLAATSLLLGILGYRIFEGMAWIDAFVNAAMILGGRVRWASCIPTPASYSPGSTRCTVD